MTLLELTALARRDFALARRAGSRSIDHVMPTTLWRVLDLDPMVTHAGPGSSWSENRETLDSILHPPVSIRVLSDKSRFFTHESLLHFFLAAGVSGARQSVDDMDWMHFADIRRIFRKEGIEWVGTTPKASSYSLPSQSIIWIYVGEKNLIPLTPRTIIAAGACGNKEGALYHVTRLSDVASILKHGLEPSGLRVSRQHPTATSLARRTALRERTTFGGFYTAHSKGKVFFSMGEAAALTWGGLIANHTLEPIVVLRITLPLALRKSMKIDMKGMTANPCSFYVTSIIPPGCIIVDKEMTQRMRAALVL